ncbi:MAG: hypothetical protein L0226_16435, partial [Acidobacteria bacterium]|nr:hypothetical protein [Acidobacteriota bacterium]
MFRRYLIIFEVKWQILNKSDAVRCWERRRLDTAGESPALLLGVKLWGACGLYISLKKELKPCH